MADGPMNANFWQTLGAMIGVVTLPFAYVLKDLRSYQRRTDQKLDDLARYGVGRDDMTDWKDEMRRANARLASSIESLSARLDAVLLHDRK